MILKESKKTFSIHEKIIKDGTQGKKNVFEIHSSEKSLNGKQLDRAAEAANEILKYKSPLKFPKKSILEQQKDIETFLKKNLIKLENKNED